MDVLLFLNARFAHNRSNNSEIYTSSHTFRYESLSRYLSVFDNVKLILRSNECSNLNYKQLYKSTGEKISAEIIPYFEGPWQFAKKYFLIKRTIKSIIERNSDCAIIFRVPCPIGFLVLDIVKIKRPFGVEVIGDPWDVFSPNSVKTVLRPFLRLFFTMKLKEACKKADAVLYVTENALQKRYTNPRRIFSASNVELKHEDYVTTPRQYRRKERWKIIYVGTLNQLYKGPDILLKAVGKIARSGFNIEIDILGDGTYRKELEILSDKLGIRERVNFRGNVSRKEVFDHLDNADLFVLPSKTEGLPRAMIEAMARGLPCIGSNVGGIPELLEPEDMVPPNDVEALSNKILEVISDVERMNKMSEKNLEKAKKYKHDILQKKREEFYRYIKDITEKWLTSGNVKK